MTIEHMRKPVRTAGRPVEYITTFTQGAGPEPVLPQEIGVLANQWNLVHVTVLEDVVASPNTAAPPTTTRTFVFYWQHEIPEEPEKQVNLGQLKKQEVPVEPPEQVVN